MTGVQVIQRPMRLVRVALVFSGTLFVLVGGFFAIRALRNPDLANVKGWLAWVAAPLKVTAGWDERWVTVAAWIALLLGLALIIVAAGLSAWVRTRPATAPARELTVDEDLLDAEVQRTHVSKTQAFIFWQALGDPRALYPRISESVESGTRTVRVETAITVSTRQFGTDVHAVPVALFTRGQLEHGLSFSSKDRLSSLSSLQSAAYALAVVDKWVRLAGRKAFSEYMRSTSASSSLRDRVSKILTCTVEGGLPGARDIADTVAKLPCPRHRREYLFAAATIVSYLSEQYPVCVPVAAEKGQESARITMHRIAFPAVQPFHRKVHGPIRQLEAARKRVMHFLRTWVGVPLHTVDYPTQMAQRTGSYHLNVRGSEGFYLAHQELRDDTDEGRTLTDTQLQNLEYAMNPRRGQRTGHLYARNGEAFGNLLYSCSFYERMPGSIATAFIGAFSTTLVAVALAWSVLFTTEEQSGLLQILLAFPLALTAASSSRNNAPFWGGDLSARAATTITVLVIAVSLITSTVWADAPRENQVVAWSVLLVVSATNALLCLLFWWSRAATHHTFLRRL